VTSRPRILFGLIFAALAGGCEIAQRNANPTFCNFDPEHLSEREQSFVISLSEKRLYAGDDAVYSLELLESDQARGFVSPFPISVPKAGLSSDGGMVTWELGGVTFSASPALSADGWMLIQSKRRPDVDASDSLNANTSVLYSPRQGVLAVQLIGSQRVQQAFLCGGGNLFVK
jgi:hypothetical protein